MENGENKPNLARTSGLKFCAIIFRHGREEMMRNASFVVWLLVND